MPGSANARARLCVVTAGHLSTCPRMLKAADAFAADGYDVRVVSTRSVAWADAADHELHARRLWRWETIDTRHRAASSVYLHSGVRWRAAQTIARAMGVGAAPFAVAVRAVGRTHDELVAAIVSEPADFIYGGTAGALAAIAAAAGRMRVPFGLDLEDYHRGEADAFGNRLARRIEDGVLDRAVFLTAGSAGIARAYAEDARFDPYPVHNTFPLPRRDPDFCSDSDALRLYWFSQGVGGGRGLEEVVRAIGLAAIPAELHLRGRRVPNYVRTLRALAAEVAPQMAIELLDPASPDTMVDLCRGYDVGLSPEPPTDQNKELCLGNKIFTYLLAGLPVVLTATTAQSALAHDLEEAALLYTPGDIETLARGLRYWYVNREGLLAAKRAAWAAARRRWHWEHPADRGALLDLVENALQSRRARNTPARSRPVA